MKRHSVFLLVFAFVCIAFFSVLTFVSSDKQEQPVMAAGLEGRSAFAADIRPTSEAPNHFDHDSKKREHALFSEETESRLNAMPSLPSDLRGHPLGQTSAPS